LPFRVGSSPHTLIWMVWHYQQLTVITLATDCMVTYHTLSTEWGVTLPTVRMNPLVYIICFTVLNSQSSKISEMFVIGSVVGIVLQLNVLTVITPVIMALKISWTSPFVPAFKMCACHWADSTHLKNSYLIWPRTFTKLSPFGLCKLISDLISCWKYSKHYETTNCGHFPPLWQIYHGGRKLHKHYSTEGISFVNPFQQ